MPGSSPIIIEAIQSPRDEEHVKGKDYRELNIFMVLDMENLINIACRTNIKMPETREDKLIKK